MDIFESDLNSSGKNRQIALIGTYPPRRCGIATFSADLSQSIQTAENGFDVDIFAMSDQNSDQYSELVKFVIEEKLPSSYLKAAETINRGGYDAVSIQHEYGIFGGVAGSLLLDLVWNIRVPIIITLHTVLDNPSLTQKLVLEALLDRSERVVVMSEKAVDILSKVHGISREKIEVIPHGIPVIPKVVDVDFRFGVSVDDPLILTFGLLSPDKGIQHVIEAMPTIVKQYPKATYAIVGATHPHILSAHGDIYREDLIGLAADLGVSDNVKFVNSFVPLEELVGYLSAMDIYITPYLKPHQITSGTLAYAVGAGKPVISTPYWYAEELLAEDRGILVPFEDSDALAQAVITIVSDPELSQAMGEKAASYGESMLWSEVGKSYASMINQSLRSHERQRRSIVRSAVSESSFSETLPDLKTLHLRELTDDVGIFQHATYSIPNRTEGYCVDDNARALMLTALLEGDESLPDELYLSQGRYLSFMLDSFNPENGRFRNFMSFQREWLEESGSEDSHGRSLWSLGTLVHRCTSVGRRKLAIQLFTDAVPAFAKTTSPRAWAYGVLGAHEYLQVFPYDISVRTFMATMANQLLQLWEVCDQKDWCWFEESLSYANARLPQALIIAGASLRNEAMLTAGLASLDWLRGKQTSQSGFFTPVGSDTFKKGNRSMEEFDQQPIEAAASVAAYLTAWETTENSIWLGEAHRAFRWFLGANIHCISLYDNSNGGCFDGLHPTRLNENQGAESTLSFLCALTQMRSAIFPKQTAPNLPGVA